MDSISNYIGIRNEINKSQGQMVSVYGLDLGTPCFSHVACSRVGKSTSLFVFSKDGLSKNIHNINIHT